jgi:hypothetical protein
MKDVKIFPRVDSEYPWSDYQDLGHSNIEVRRDIALSKWSSDIYNNAEYKDLDSYVHKNNNKGFLELEKTQTWKELGYKVGDKFSFAKNDYVYKITNIDANIASIVLCDSVLEKIDAKVAVPIPVHGRVPLVYETVAMLKRQTLPVDKIILIGEEKEVAPIAEETGVLWIQSENYPLGNKWQVGMDYARQFEPDAIMMLGSSDWVSEKWCEVMMREISKNPDISMIGKRNMMFLDVDNIQAKRLISWNGYARTGTAMARAFEPIGAGRMITKDILEKINWQFYDRSATKSMDFISLMRIKSKNAIIKFINDPCNLIMALSLSFYHKWGNMHGFETMCRAEGYLTSKRVENIDETLEQYFAGYQDSLYKINIDG